MLVAADPRGPAGFRRRSRHWTPRSGTAQPLSWGLAVARCCHRCFRRLPQQSWRWATAADPANLRVRHDSALREAGHADVAAVLHDRPARSAHAASAPRSAAAAPACGRHRIPGPRQVPPLLLLLLSEGTCTVSSLARPSGASRRASRLSVMTLSDPPLGSVTERHHLARHPIESSSRYRSCPRPGLMPTATARNRKLDLPASVTREFSQQGIRAAMAAGCFMRSFSVAACRASQDT